MELSTHNKTLKAGFFHCLLTMFGMKSQTNTTKQDIFICRGVTNLIQINNKMSNYIDGKLHIDIIIDSSRGLLTEKQNKCSLNKIFLIRIP